MKKGEKVNKQISNELRNIMEQTNQNLVDQIEKSNQALLQALQNMGNSINNLRNNNASGRDVSSNHSENNEASSSWVPKPPFLPWEKTLDGRRGTNN